MSWIPAPLVLPEDERTPVTVWLDPSQAARLEVLIARRRKADPTTDDNAVVDDVFACGLDAAERETTSP